RSVRRGARGNAGKAHAQAEGAVARLRSGNAERRAARSGILLRQGEGVPGRPRGVASKAPSPGSIALEVVAGGGMALRRPTFRAPIFDKARLADERLETISFAHRGVRRMPQPAHFSAREAAAIEKGLIIVQDAAGRPHVQINPRVERPK